MSTGHCTRRSPAACASGSDARVHTGPDRKSTRLNSSHSQISYAVFCLKKKKKTKNRVSILVLRQDTVWLSVAIFTSKKNTINERVCASTIEVCVTCDPCVANAHKTGRT